LKKIGFLLFCLSVFSCTSELDVMKQVTNTHQLEQTWGKPTWCMVDSTDHSYIVWIYKLTAMHHSAGREDGYSGGGVYYYYDCFYVHPDSTVFKWKTGLPSDQ